MLLLLLVMLLSPLATIVSIKLLFNVLNGYRPRPIGLPTFVYALYLSICLSLFLSRGRAIYRFIGGALNAGVR